MRLRNHLVAGLFVLSSRAEATADRTAKPVRPGATQTATAKLRAALAGRNKPALTDLLASHVKLRGLWFTSDACRMAFRGRTTVPPEHRDMLAGCLLELGLKMDRHDSLSYAPGISVYTSIEDGKIARIASLEIDDSAPTVDDRVLEQHARTTLEVKRDATTSALIAKDPEAYITVDVRLCIDPKGKVDALATQADAEYQSYRATVEAAARAWRFKPFMRNGRAIRVCASYTVEAYDESLGVVGGVAGGTIVDEDGPAPAPPPPIR